MLSERQIERYSRQILIPQVGGIGQEKLLAAHVAIVGSGEAALIAATYLAAAGIGRLLVPEALRDTVAAVNDDCAVVCLSLPVAAAAVERSAVVISLQADALELSTLHRLCITARTTLFWGSAHGVWVSLYLAQEPPLSLCIACLIEATGEEASPPAAFWTGSQLAAATIAAIIGAQSPRLAARHDIANIITGAAAAALPALPCRRHDGTRLATSEGAEAKRG